MARKVRKNADDLLRKLERIAFQTEDRADILAYWVASLRAGILPKPTRVFEKSGNYVYVANIKEYERDFRDDVVRIKEEMPRLFVGNNIVLWDWYSKTLTSMYHDSGVFPLTPENLMLLLQELVDYETT